MANASSCHWHFAYVDWNETGKQMVAAAVWPMEKVQHNASSTSGYRDSYFSPSIYISRTNVALALVFLRSSHFRSL